MEPFSISVSILTLVHLCGTLFRTISSLSSPSSHPPTPSLPILQEEINSLSSTLSSLGSSLENLIVSEGVLRLAQQTGGDENQHWIRVKASLEECGRTLEALNRLMGEW